MKRKEKTVPVKRAAFYGGFFYSFVSYIRYNWIDAERARATLGCSKSTCRIPIFKTANACCLKKRRWPIILHKEKKKRILERSEAENA